jgi:uncharacterized membrane protein YphA (DoxX/SURF4 family)
MTTHQSGTSSPAATGGSVLPSASTLGKGLAVLRIFMGIVLFANGVAKLFEFRRIEVGPYVANLIDKGAARSILANGLGEQERSIPGLRPVMEVMVDNWTVVGWALTVTELLVGALLIVGAATRLAALIGLGQALFLALVFATRNRWAFEQPHEYVPLIILAIVPAGRVWGRRRPAPAPQAHLPGRAAGVAVLTRAPRARLCSSRPSSR